MTGNSESAHTPCVRNLEGNPKDFLDAILTLRRLLDGNDEREDGTRSSGTKTPA